MAAHSPERKTRHIPFPWQLLLILQQIIRASHPAESSQPQRPLALSTLPKSPFRARCADCFVAERLKTHSTTTAALCLGTPQWARYGSDGGSGGGAPRLGLQTKEALQDLRQGGKVRQPGS
jgi:hypothetical protein